MRKVIHFFTLVVVLVAMLALGNVSRASNEAVWPPIKVDLSIQQDGNTFTATVWVKNEGDFDTDVLNVKGQVPKGAKYVDSWAGSGRGFNAGVFDGNDVGWVNSGIKAGSRQGPFVYMFDTSALAANSQATMLAWVSWAGKVPGNALSKAVSIRTPPAALVPPFTVRVIVPLGDDQRDNLQFMAFWIAQGAGFFKEEGLDVQLVEPPNPPVAAQWLAQGQGEVALLPPPGYLPLIEQRQPILLFARILQNDPLNLIVRKEVAEARKLSPAAPLAERLRGLQGLKVGIAPGPVPRLRALFESAGMDFQRDVQVEFIPGPQQNQAFAENRVDALFAHTPFLERALVEQAAVLLVNLSRGELPDLANLEIHSLVTTRRFADSNPEVLLALTRAVYRAQRLVHTDLKAAADALLRSRVRGLEPHLAETILAIYQPAVPDTSEVSVKGIERANRYYYLGRPADLSNINLSDYVAPQFAEQAVGGQTTTAAPAGAIVRLNVGVGTPRQQAGSGRWRI